MSNNEKIIKRSKKAILLVNLGTPDSYQVKDIRKYLKEFLSDRRVIEASSLIWQPILRLFILPFRSPKTAKLYQKVWFEEDNASPLMHYTKAQARKLADKLGNEVIVDFAMRYGQPSIKAKIEALSIESVTDVTVVPLYPQYSATTTASVYDEVFRVLQAMRYQPNIVGVAPYYEHPAYIDALKQSVIKYLATIDFTPDVLLLSFHGIPLECVQKGDPYQAHCLRTFELLKNALSETNLNIQLSFQSRFGPKEWLTPYTTDVLANLAKEGKKNVLVMAPGFAADCLETLEELKETERETFLNAGGEHYAVIPCLNDRDEHINMLKTIIGEQYS
ncbi:ferrochelatase [Cysteiniphilum sp. 6C5]|uniref:ferrochelatase n=1 Tax=unclassified Cysteiniphilum TaxID=2610889 RepID=UPI003F85B105